MSKNNKNQKVRNRSRGDKSATSSTASASTSESESVNKNTIAKATSNEKSRNLFEKKSFGLPLFALSANDNGYVVAGGGGGAAKTGIKNALVRINFVVFSIVFVLTSFFILVKFKILLCISTL